MKINEAKTVFDLFNGHPERWIKGKTQKGEQFCVLGAIIHIYASKGEKAVMKLLQIIPIKWIGEWNDLPELTFDEMLAKVKEAGI